MSKLLIALFSFIAFECKGSERAALVYGNVKILKKSDKRKVRFKDVVQVDRCDLWQVPQPQKNSLQASASNQTKSHEPARRVEQAPEKSIAIIISDLSGLNTATNGLFFIDPETGNYI